MTRTSVMTRISDVSVMTGISGDLYAAQGEGLHGVSRVVAPREEPRRVHDLCP